jgi:hypothetical protein
MNHFMELPNDSLVNGWPVNNSEPDEKSLARIIKQTGFNGRDPFIMWLEPVLKQRALLEELNLTYQCLDEAISHLPGFSEIARNHGFYLRKN